MTGINTGQPNIIAGLQGLTANPVNVDVDLSIARPTGIGAPVPLTSDTVKNTLGGISQTPPASNFLYVDTEAYDIPDAANNGTVSATKTTGRAYFWSNIQQSSPLLLEAGRAYFIPNFAQGWIANAAQANKMLRLIFSPFPIFPNTPASPITVNGQSAISIVAGGNTAAVSAKGGLQIAGPAGADYTGKFGTSFVRVANVTGVTTALAPASNVNGVWLRTARCDRNATSSAVIVCDTAAPANSGDSTKRAVLGTANGSGFAGAEVLPYPVFLPAGVGIYVVGSGAANNEFDLTWDVL